MVQPGTRTAVTPPAPSVATSVRPQAEWGRVNDPPGPSATDRARRPAPRSTTATEPAAAEARGCHALSSDSTASRYVSIRLGGTEYGGISKATPPRHP